MKSCSVIIVNYNTGTLLVEVVNSVLAEPQVSEVIVVDNNSQDHSMALLAEHKKLKKYYRKDNPGFASSCNYGAQFAQADSLLFLNPDCIIKQGSIGILLTELQKEAQSAIIGCMITNADGSEQRAARRRLPTFLRAVKTFTGLEKLAKYCHCFAGVNLNHRPLKEHVHKVEAISGALIMIKAKVFKNIAGFDEAYPLHFEDLDLFKRTLDAGYAILLHPGVSALHHQGISSQTNPKVAELKQLGMQRYFNRHCSTFAYLMIVLLNKLR
ncbi:MAG TPA: glycosyltransferase family 2 protein [Oceanospirillales bacterium]|nr:glycosyltransferase family 2 protein [Oceanospirillales bacterium]